MNNEATLTEEKIQVPTEEKIQAPKGKKTQATPKGKKRILVAGIGNPFLKDDGFGTAVIKKLIEKKSLPAFVEVSDIGIGGLKLAYDLMRGYDGLVLIDASPRGEEPGTLYVIEPDEREVNADLTEGNFIDPHGCDPATVLRFIKALNAWPGKVVIIGCEPSNTEDFDRELSDPVTQAMDKAVILTEEIIAEMINS